MYYNITMCIIRVIIATNGINYLNLNLSSKYAYHSTQ